MIMIFLIIVIYGALFVLRKHLIHNKGRNNVISYDLMFK